MTKNVIKIQHDINVECPLPPFQQPYHEKKNNYMLLHNSLFSMKIENEK